MLISRQSKTPPSTHRPAHNPAKKAQQEEMNPALMAENTALFANLKGIADAIVSLLGRDSEVCIHDLTSLQKSLVFYIAGDVTGRKPGAPTTDLQVRVLQQEDHEIRDLASYRTTSNDGRSLKSATVFIRNAARKPVAASCINLDTTRILQCQSAAPALHKQPGNATGKKRDLRPFPGRNNRIPVRPSGHSGWQTAFFDDHGRKNQTH